MPVSVSCSWHVKGEGGDPACLCQSPAPATLREKEEILYACVSFLLLPRYVRGGDLRWASVPSPPGVRAWVLALPFGFRWFPRGVPSFLLSMEEVVP